MMRKSIATVSLSGTLEEKLAAAAQVGFDGVELFEPDLISCPLTPAQVGDRARELGLRIELYQPMRDMEGMPSDAFERNLRRAAKKFDLMCSLGVDTVLVCSNVSPLAMASATVAARQLGQLADLAAEWGIRIAYEALAWGRYVNDYRTAWRIVAAADRPNLGVCLDSFHILSREHDPAGIAEIPGDRIFFVQLADAPSLGLEPLRLSRHHRCFVGQGHLDVVGFMRHVLAAGYQGPLSLEVFNDVFRQSDARRTATDALRSLIALEESLAATHIPVPADLGGYAFVELTVDPLAELATQSLLRGMGFAPSARHRSKPVQMWQQGQARILLNRTPTPTDGWSRSGAAIRAMAVESAEPRQSAARAEALLAPAIARRYGPGEADLYAAAAPDGTSVFFCRSDTSDPLSWLSDFDSAGVAGGPADDGALTAIDHVALSQPAFYFDEAALFYQTVFGLSRHDGEDVADPYGLVRNRAMTNSDRRLRLVLTVPALGGGRPPESADHQHVAFRTADIFASARAMRERGLPTLSVPDNYYEDLAAHTDLDPATIADLRAFDILYDRDDEGGAFYHYYTAMVGPRMFFEITQRAGGYDGYGTRNTAVRTAAQYRGAALSGITA